MTAVDALVTLDASRSAAVTLIKRFGYVEEYAGAKGPGTVSVADLKAWIAGT